MSCVLSYIYMSLLTLIIRSIEIYLFIRYKLQISIGWHPLITSALAFILGTFFSLLFAKIYTCSTFKNVMVKLFHKTPNDDIWRDVLDLDNGSNLKVYLKNQDYYVIGHHKNHEEKDGESWLALSAFCKIDKTTNRIFGNEKSYLDKEDVIITIRFSDIEHIEIF